MLRVINDGIISVKNLLVFKLLEYAAVESSLVYLEQAVVASKYPG